MQKTNATATHCTSWVLRIGSHASSCAKSTPARTSCSRVATSDRGRLPGRTGCGFRRRGSRARGKRTRWSLSTRCGSFRRRAALRRGWMARVDREHDPADGAMTRGPMLTMLTILDDDHADHVGDEEAPAQPGRRGACVCGRGVRFIRGDDRAGRAGGRAGGRRHRLVALAVDVRRTDDCRLTGTSRRERAPQRRTSPRCTSTTTCASRTASCWRELYPRDHQVAVARAEAEPTQAESAVAGVAPEVLITRQSNEKDARRHRRGLTNAEAALAAAARDDDAAEVAVRRGAGHAAKGGDDSTRDKYLLGQHVVRGEVRVDCRDGEDGGAALDKRAGERAPWPRRSSKACARRRRRRARARRRCGNAPHQLFGQRAGIAARQSAVRAAKAALGSRRKLNLGNTRIVAP